MLSLVVALEAAMTDQPVEIDATACRLLWAEVFLASVADAWNDPLDRWVGTRDFYTVAALAGLDHDIAQELAVASRDQRRFGTLDLSGDADSGAQPDRRIGIRSDLGRTRNLDADCEAAHIRINQAHG